MANLPDRPRVRYHSIIGNDTPNLPLARQQRWHSCRTAARSLDRRLELSCHSATACRNTRAPSWKSAGS